MFKRAMKFKELSENQQLLIERYYDGESGFINRFLARRLIRRSENAKNYYDELTVIPDALGHFYSQESSGSSVQKRDLQKSWEALESRILQEERAAILVGERTVEETDNTFWKFFSFDQFGPFGAGVGSTLALAGVLALFVIGPYFTINEPQTLVSKITNNEVDELEFNRVNLSESEWVGAQPVELVSSMLQQTPVPPLFLETERISVPQVQMASTGTIGARKGPVVEVDWVKSDGRVRMIHSPSANAPILWVKKRVPQSYLRHQLQRKQNQR